MPGQRRRSAAGDRGGRLDHPSAELAGREHPCPGIEQHQRLGARLDLRDQVFHGGVLQRPDQPSEQGRIGIGEAPGRGEFLAATAFQHVAGHGETAAGEADQRGPRRFRGQALAHPRDRLQDRRDARDHLRRIERGDRFRTSQRIEQRPLAFREAQRLPERPGHHQDVGEQDRAFHAEAADRLEGDFRRQFRRGAQGDEIARLGAHGAVFRQVSPGLAHQPGRRRPDGFATQRAQQGLGRGRRDIAFHTAPLNKE